MKMPGPFGLERHRTWIGPGRPKHLYGPLRRRLAGCLASAAMINTCLLASFSKIAVELEYTFLFPSRNGRNLWAVIYYPRDAGLVPKGEIPHEHGRRIPARRLALPETGGSDLQSQNERLFAELGRLLGQAGG